MDLLITLIITFIGAIAVGLGCWLIKKYVHIVTFVRYFIIRI